MGNNFDREFVTLVATHTTDRVPMPDGGFVALPGGPAHYVGRALERLRCPYHLITGETVTVEVQRTPSGEQYVIPSLPLIPLPERLHGAAVILSPIMQEIEAVELPEIDGILIVDLQGFVRRPMQPTESEGEKFDLVHLFRRADFVKASEGELHRLDSRSLAALERRTLIITRGDRGAIVRRGGNQEMIPAEPVSATQTIGAGDSFLAAFARALVLGKGTIEAAHSAARFTEEVLRERLVGDSG
jgi:pfkB family carbohydrate kinase